jgi:hypothetical protein
MSMTKGTPESSQIITLTRMLERSEDDSARLRKELATLKAQHGVLIDGIKIADDMLSEGSIDYLPLQVRTLATIVRSYSECATHREQPAQEPMPCPDCFGSEIQGFKRGVRCATCNGTGEVEPPLSGHTLKHLASNAIYTAQEPVGEVTRYGEDSHGRQWHGIHWYDPNLDVPDGTKLFAAPYQAQKPVAWMREWEGDVSDLGNMIFAASEDEKDDNQHWIPLYTTPQNAQVDQLKAALALAREAIDRQPYTMDKQVCEALAAIGATLGEKT